MAPMTGIEMATAMIKKGRPKKVKRLVKWLERELAEARSDLQTAGHRLDAINILLMQKNDDLVQARNERDMLRIQIQQNARRAQEDRENWIKTRLVLEEANAQLGRANQGNFDRAARKGEVAAVLARMAAEKDSPAEAMMKFSEAAIGMDVDLIEISEEVRAAFKRGYSAEVDMVVTAANERANERAMFDEEKSVSDETFLDDDAFQDAVERYGMPPDFSGYNRY